MDAPTPVVHIRIDRLRRNISAMAEFCVQEGLELRPHAKTHKVLEIAQL